MVTPLAPAAADKVLFTEKIEVLQRLISIYNELLAKSWDGTAAYVYQRSLQAKIVEAGIQAESAIFDPIKLYEAQGWTVTYEPDYSRENYSGDAFKHTRNKFFFLTKHLPRHRYYRRLWATVTEPAPLVLQDYVPPQALSA